MASLCVAGIACHTWSALAQDARSVKPSARGSASKAAAPASLQLIAALPRTIVLRGLYDEARPLFDSRSASGSRDASGQVQLTIADSKIATVDEIGTVRPLRDGKSTLIARLGSYSVAIPVVVQGIALATPPQFINDVIPVLTRTGCNMGACHGAGSGKGGFKLSLQGYDPDLDYTAIARGAALRRIARTQPENSLLLRKATLGVVHKGGQRFRVGSPEYRILRDWIAAGMPGPSSKEARVVKLEIVPPVRTLQSGQTQRFAVFARYTDGSRRDVTSQTLFTAGDETVAAVTPEGEAKATGSGEGAVLIRYQGIVATARVISPFAAPITSSMPSVLNRAPRTRDCAAADMIDRLVQQKLDSLGLTPSPLCTDADFIRRVYLDVTGLLPSPAQIRAFLASRDPQRREKIIDSLLESGEYVDFWSLKWGDLLRSSRKLLTDRGMVTFNDWIRRSVAENKPWDQFAKEILVAQGSPYDSGPPNFFRTASTANELAEATSQTFLGVRIQCARCHNHPYEKWTQNQYYEMAAFFARVHSKKGSGSQEQLVTIGKSGEVTHPKTAKTVQPCALDDNPVAADYRGDRRVVLAEWLTSPRNPFFAKSMANRLWKHFMGRGLVEPVDDLRLTNPPSNAELFDRLALDLADNGFNMKHTMRAIMLSRVYQRSPMPTAGNERDTRYYSHFGFKRLSAEQLMDAIASATGVAEKFAGYPLGVRAAQLPDTAVPSYFLELFGRPARSITCACERTDDPNLGQVLHLMNDAGINTRLAAPAGRIAQLVASKRTSAAVVQDVYLASVSRLPSPGETEQGTQALDYARNSVRHNGGRLFDGQSWIPGRAIYSAERARREKAEDLMWALMNSKEFMFNH